MMLHSVVAHFHHDLNVPVRLINILQPGFLDKGCSVQFYPSIIKRVASNSTKLKQKVFTKVIKKAKLRGLGLIDRVSN